MSIRQVNLSQINNAALRKAAEQVETTAGVGTKDGVLTTAEVDSALALAKTQPAKFGDIAALRSLRTFLVHMGDTPGAAPAASTISGGGYSPVGLQAGNMMGTVQKAKDTIMLNDMTRPDAVSTYFSVPSDKRMVEDRQSVVLPLEAKEIHLIELQYQDTRPLKDLEFTYQPKGSMEWKAFKGDKWFEMEAKEKSGELKIRREPDHNSPYVNNPIKVQVDVLFPDGHVHSIGKKFLDYSVHDAHSIDGAGYPEIDNISNGYEHLPQGALPEGCLLRLTPLHENRKPWEADRKIAMDLAWVKPQFLPTNKERAVVFQSGNWVKPDPAGYAVDPNRKIAAVMVTWTDHGKPYSASVSIGKNEKGVSWSSPSTNVGSGETELISVDGYAKDGRIKVNGQVDVNKVQVLYAE